jgi:hypothetical protein
MKHYVDEDYDDKGNQIGKRYDVFDCPFCGSKNTDLYQVQVKCERCDAHGPEVAEEIWPLAITLWNDLPRKQGKELEKLRSHWANLLRRVRRAEKKAKIAREDSSEDRQAREIARRLREDRQWVAEREAWLHAPVVMDYEALGDDHG